MRLTKFLLTPIVALSFVDASVAFASDCSVKHLTKQPSWISSAELNSNELLVADPKSRELIAYNISTWEARVVPLASGVTPASITRIQGGFLVKNGDDAELLSPDAKPGGQSFNLQKTKAGPATGLGSLYTNWITKGSTFLGYGAINHTNLANGQYDPARGFALGFVKGKVGASLGEFRDVEMLEPTDDNSYYLFGLPYFAATDDGLFFVQMRSGGQASIRHVREGKPPALEELSAFPEAFRAVPSIKTPSLGPVSTAPRFAEIQKAKIAVGLFGQGSLLYLLTRQPSQTGEGTEWLMFQINPKEAKPRGAVRLPTTAAHLSLVPGPNSWYLIERGEVRGWGNQDIKSVIQVPTAWIASLESSPLNVKNLRVMQCGVP